MTRLWEWWKRVARKIGDFQGRLILTLFYFIVLAPFALILRLVADPLAIASKAPSGWQPRPESRGDALDRARRQF